MVVSDHQLQNTPAFCRRVVARLELMHHRRARPRGSGSAGGFAR
jgi:hypothetical protein